MRKENRKQKQRKKQKLFIFLTLLFVSAACLTIFTMGFFDGGKEETKSAVGSSKEPVTEKTSETSSVFTEEKTTETEEEVIELPDENNTEFLDDSALLGNAGQVSYGVYYFNNGTYISNNNNGPMVSASVIKVFIMSYIYENQIEAQMTAAGETLGSLTQRMIQVSDNYATNVIIEHLGMETLNNYFKAAGYPSTQLQRKMVDEQARSLGKENYTSLEDAMTFLKKIYQNKETSPYSSMLDLMLGQQIKTKIPRMLPPEIPVANKTGELPGVENDIGLVLGGREPFAIVVLSNNVINSEGMRQAIGDFALAAMGE